MDEQKRIFVAVALCLGVIFAWQYFVPQPGPKPGVKSNAPSAPSSEGGGASVLAVSSPSAAPSGVGAPAAAFGATAAPAALAVSTASRAFSTPLLSGALGNDGALSRLDLATYQEAPKPGAPLQHVSLATAPIAGVKRQALVSLSVDGVSTPLAFVGAEGGAGPLELSGSDTRGVRTSLVVRPRQDAYALDYELSVRNDSSVAVKAGATIYMASAPHEEASGGNFMTPPADLVHGVCAKSGSVERWLAKDAEKEPRAVAGADWAGLDRQYFVVALMPEADRSGTCRVSGQGKEVLVDYVFDGGELAPGATWKKKVVLYVGPKRDSELKKVAANLSEVIDYNIWGIPLGFLARPMVAVLNFFHDWTTSWGLAIILLTLLVKLLLFPVTYKSAVSMRRMQLVKPELDALKVKFGNDRERMQMEQMKLFREKGVNPLGGCLPMLLQMPVWFALYRTLWTAVDLYQQKFLWLENLTAKESFPFLAIAFGALTVVQQRVTPMSTDSQQAKIMMYVMPLMFTVFMISLPSGLVLYIVVNSILTIVQQLVINKRTR